MIERRNKKSCTELTSESSALSTASGIGSGQNSSGRKLSRIHLIIDALNVGQTLSKKQKKRKYK